MKNTEAQPDDYSPALLLAVVDLMIGPATGLMTALASDLATDSILPLTIDTQITVNTVSVRLPLIHPHVLLTLSLNERPSVLPTTRLRDALTAISTALWKVVLKVSQAIDLKTR